MRIRDQKGYQPIVKTECGSDIIHNEATETPWKQQCYNHNLKILRATVKVLG